MGYVKKHPDKIVYYRNKENSGSAKINFMNMLSNYGASNCDYIMFCDQDNVWYPNKISTSIEAMKKMEQEYGENIPLLCTLI
jgi:GT2 family glycosyltransferase